MVPAGAVYFFVGFAAALIAAFAYVTLRGIRASPRAVMPYYGELVPPVAGAAELPVPAARPLRILVATDGSPCSDRAVQSVAARGWPRDSQVEVVTVVFSRVPPLPDPQLMIEAAHVEALEAERQRAPARVQRAERCLATASGVSVSGRILEGHPQEALIEEAERWHADLIVVGSHGYGPVRRRLLGSVSQGVALHAPCSVEIVRCPHGGAGS